MRHGESEANRNWSVNVAMPNHLVPLTANGREQADQCGTKISELLEAKDRIIVFQSPYERTRQTADGVINAIFRHPNSSTWNLIERNEDPQMREQDFGNFQNEQKMKEVLSERSDYGFFFYRIPNGESPADVYDRCSVFCERLFRKFEVQSPDVVILVSHGIWGRVFLMRYFHWSYEYLEKLCNLPNAEPVVLVLQDDGKYVISTPLECYE